MLKNARIWYWGDLDVQGFEILALFRERVPETRALLMDRATWQKFQHHAVPGKEARTSLGPHLTAEEAELYEELKGCNLRLEQERISHAWAAAQIRNMLS